MFVNYAHRGASEYYPEKGYEVVTSIVKPVILEKLKEKD